MKVYSNNNITKEEVEAIASDMLKSAATTTATVIDAVDKKQAEQIHKLRILLGVSFGVNLLVAIGAYFF